MKGKFLPALTPLREERLRHRLPLETLAHESRIPLSTLSRAERGLRPLTDAQERRRHAVLRRLGVKEPVTP